MSKSVFGEVLVELLEEHGVGTYELALRGLARQTGLNADLLIARMYSPDVERPGDLDLLADYLKLAPTERARLARAYALEE
jgi:hypothetical protein